MVSDDTEHACLVAQALIASAGEPESFRRRLAQGLRRWLRGLPAGVGWATLRATLKLCVGVPPTASGVCFGAEPGRLRALVRASTRMTHTDPNAEAGALAVAVAAWVAGQAESAPLLAERYLEALGQALGVDAPEMTALAERAARSAAAGETTQAFAASLGCGHGVGGYVYHTVPVTLHAWFRHPADYRAGILEIIRCGGDTDTTAAILGAIVGAAVGPEGIPVEWRAALWEWPRTTDWMTRLAAQLTEVYARGKPQTPLELPFLPLLGRNVAFAVLVIGHGLRRLLPPY